MSNEEWKNLVKTLDKKIKQKFGHGLSSNVIKVLSNNVRSDYLNIRNDLRKFQINSQDNPHLVSSINEQTMSAPHIHSLALKLMYDTLKPILISIGYNYNKLKFNVLDIGCGTGYVLACMIDLIKIERNNSSAVGIDIYKSLVELTKKNLRKKGLNPDDNQNLKVLCSDGWKGYVQKAPYNFIHVGAMANKIPIKLINQLAIGGSMLIPVNGQYLFITVLKSKNINSSQLLSDKPCKITDLNIPEENDIVCSIGNKIVKIRNIYSVRFVTLINTSEQQTKKKKFKDNTPFKCILDIKEN